ncbi:unnamed protein product, partial [Bubo scandiacus]
MEGTGPWLVPSSHEHHQMLPELTSDLSKEFCNNRRGNKASQSSSFIVRDNSTSTQRPLPICSSRGCHLGGRLRSLRAAERRRRGNPRPSRAAGEGRAAGRLLASSSPAAAAAARLCGQRRAVSIAARRGPSPRGAGIHGPRQRAGGPSPAPDPPPPSPDTTA